MKNIVAAVERGTGGGSISPSGQATTCRGTEPSMESLRFPLKGSFKGHTDIVIDIDVDIDRHGPKV